MMDCEIVHSGESGDLILVRYTGNDECVILPDDVTAVADGAFMNNRKIRHVDLRNTERIGARAFQDCVRLQSAKMLNVTSIGPMSFEFCSELSHIETGEIINIGDYAFSHCSNLDLSDIRGSLTEIGAGAFAYTATKRADVRRMEEIPEMLFCGCSSLEYADFRNAGIIGNNAFGLCSALKFIRLGDIEKIGDRAFNKCSSLEFSSLPSALQSIGDDAIETIMPGLIIPQNVRHIGCNCLGPEERSKSFSIYRSALYEFRNYFNDVHQYEFDDEKFFRCESTADVTVLDDETGDVTGFLPLFTDTSGELKSILRSAFRPDNTFDYSVLDERVFEYLSWRLSSKDRLAFMRLSYPFGLSESASGNYVEYLSRHAARISMRAVRNNDVRMLMLLHDHGLISEEFIDRILDQSISRSASECTAFLLECKSEMAPAVVSLFDEL